MKNYIFYLVFISSFFFQSSEGNADTSKNDLSKEALIKRMQKGGMVLYFRHASTENDYADQVNANVNDGSTQRVLSEKGWHEAVHIGNAIRFYNIPVGKVISSEYFRAWQTAWLAFGEYEKKADLNFLPFADFTDEQMATMKKRVVPFISTMPEKGKNTIIVAHDDPFEASTGIYPEPQGVCFILNPHGNGKFEILGQIAPGDWKLK